ncbi:MAG TPA: SAM-dependent methyltransferase [Candidatus Omnitrophica bacterium]|nr:SAM-dependent methyltransferase [Candidatus Omnitrophota bacterium]
MRDEIRTGLPTGIRRIIIESKRAGFKIGGRILDCGCGEGKISGFLARELAPSQVIGTDISCDKLLEASGKGGLFFASNLDRGSALPFKDATFKLVFCNHVIEHLLDPDHLLDEIYRVLADDGVLVLTTPNLAVWYNRIMLLFGFQPHFTEVSMRHNVGKLYYGSLRQNSASALGGHIRVFTYLAMRELLALHGIRITASFGYGHPTMLDSMVIGIFERLAQLRTTLTSTMCFVCLKDNRAKNV